MHGGLLGDGRRVNGPVATLGSPEPTELVPLAIMLKTLLRDPVPIEWFLRAISVARSLVPGTWGDGVPACLALARRSGGSTV
jgi:hypothetical protein